MEISTVSLGEAGHHRHEHAAGPLRQRRPLGRRPGTGATDAATRGRGFPDGKSAIAVENPGTSPFVEIGKKVGMPIISIDWFDHAEFNCLRLL